MFSEFSEFFALCMSRTMDVGRGIMEESGTSRFRGPQLSPYNVEQNADLHIIMLRNNTFVHLTDSKGQKEPGVCTLTGCLPDRGKDSRYGAKAAAEHVGRDARKAGVKAVVVKISGFTHLKKKRQAIMAFREGYTYGCGDQTPIVFIEDKTRHAHNGCRKPKSAVSSCWKLDFGLSCLNWGLRGYYDCIMKNPLS